MREGPGQIELTRRAAATANVLAIGSCRIFRPLRHLHKRGDINLLNHGQCQWFTHSAGSARQYVDVIQARASIPAELREAALETTIAFPDDMRWQPSHPPDLTIVEVSSLKEHRVGRTQLNAHKIYQIVRRMGLPHRPVLSGDTAALASDHELKPLHVERTSERKLADDLLAIRRQLDTVLLTVNHLYSEKQNGEPVVGRVEITNELEKLEREHGVAFFDTKDIILEHGVDIALLDQNHYRPEFEPVVAAALLARIRALGPYAKRQ